MKQRIRDNLHQILSLSEKHASLSIELIINMLAEKGSFILLIVFSIPFCIPLPIPGLSIPFGIVLTGLGIQLLLRKQPWLPQRILKKKLSTKQVGFLIKKTLAIILWIEKVIPPRWKQFATHPLSHRISGLVISLLALLLALPLPIPVTNVFAAIPICLISLSLLEDNGLLLLISYAVAFLGLSCFGLLFFLGWDFIRSFL